MPLYEYSCEACSGREERLESISAPMEHDCPDCGTQGAMKRQISVAAFALTGEGWFKQGYGKGAKSGTPKPETPSTGGGCCGGGCACPALKDS
jgi:putative FmdB family regulatory protein